MVTGIQSNIDGALDGSGDIEINGQEGSYTLVLIDGIPISGGNATVYAISGIPMSIVERIEVMQGPLHLLFYGTDAIAGVINIITISPGKAPRFSIQAGTNSYLENKR
jgi:outer membrane receptor for ferrienterochelin and colicins